ncbi:M15 family metallopeptidase [Nocardioides montaniterrae]
MIHARRGLRQRALALGASGLLGAALLSGCGGSGPAKHPSAAPSTQPIAHAADPSHAIGAPGKWDGKLPGDDLLVVSDKTLPADVLKKIDAIRIGKGKGAVKGVQVSVPLSIKQFSLENQLYNVAAVDPARYRDFTGAKSAGWQEQWNRIAGGEMAVVQRLQGTLPLDKDGYVAVGSGDQSQKIHLGAWSPSTVEGIDVMVNTKWGDDLGIPEDNALLINTGFASPDDVRKQIEKIDKSLSITALDAVAQNGIDPKAVQNVQFVGAFSQAVGLYRYTAVGGGRVVPSSAWVASHIETRTMPIIGPMTCNKYIFPQLYAALREIQARGLADKITNYAGCFVPRFIAGTTTLSNHAFGLAFDIDPADNARGTVGHMDPGVIQTFQRWGFTWGGTWRYTDPMHFELNHLVKPGS